jgi:hypothetical protein
LFYIINFYSLVIDDTYSIIGHPGIEQHRDYLGHFTNDSVKMKTNPSEKDILEYNFMSRKNSNVDFYSCHAGLISSRDNEELFVTYGSKYWENLDLPSAFSGI